MKLTDDHKVQIFCAALTASIQAATKAPTGATVVVKSPVETASLITAEAIVKLQSKAWATS
jgi:hypothetical protein